MIGIISDTHDNIPKIKKAVEIFKDKNVKLVLHLGDIIAGITVQYFNGLNIKFLKGNCVLDDIELLKEKIKEINGEYLGDSFELNINNKKIFLIHKPNFKDKIGKYDYIIYGHTHQKEDKKEGKTRIINPGSLYLGEKENSIAILNLNNDKLEFINV